MLFRSGLCVLGVSIIGASLFFLLPAWQNLARLHESQQQSARSHPIIESIARVDRGTLLGESAEVLLSVARQERNAVMTAQTQYDAVAPFCYFGIAVGASLAIAAIKIMMKAKPAFDCETTSNTMPSDHRSAN